MLILPAAAMPVRESSEPIGNQMPADAPRLRDGDGRFNVHVLEEFGDWFEDRFAFRPELVAADSKIKSKLFNVSSQDSVIEGTDGWLYYEATVDDFQHRNEVSERKLFNEAHNMALMQEYTELLGKQFIFTIAPNKNSLYGQNMPSRYQVRVAEKSDAERLIPYLHSEGVNYADLYSLFSESDGPALYYKRDSHWNETGAVMVYNTLMDAAGKEHESYHDITPAVTDDYVGDLEKMLCPVGGRTETKLTYLPEDERLYEYATDTVSVEENEIETRNPSREGSLLMYRDSFGNSLLPYFAQEYGHAYFSKVVPYPMTDLVTAAPDTVIVEKVERHLPTLSEVPPLMSAPVREVDFSKINSDGVRQDPSITVSPNGSYLEIRGVLPEQQTNTRIFIAVTDAQNTSVFEAFCVSIGGNDFGFCADLPAMNLTGEIEKIQVIAVDAAEGDDLPRLSAVTEWNEGENE